MSSTRIAVATVLVGIALLTVVLLSGGGGYTVRAEFANADGLRSGFFVENEGVPVGHVTNVTLARGDRAMVTMVLNAGAAPIGAGARAEIRPNNLLGEKYVDLTRGDSHHAAASGTLIPLSRTSTPAELDDVLDTLNGQTRTALGVFLAEQGDALVGRSADLATTLGRMPRALSGDTELITNVDADNHALGDLIDRTDRILAAVSANRGAMGQLVQSADGALGTLAAQQRGLRATINEAPAAVAQLNRSLVALQQAAQPLIPAAIDLRAAAPSLHRTLLALPPFATAARPALRALTAVAPELSTLANRGTPVVQRLLPLAGQLVTFASTLAPDTGILDQNIANSLGVMEGWARAIQNRDAAGHVFRLGIVLSPASRNALLNFVLAAARRPARAPAAAHAPAATSPGSRPLAWPADPAQPTAGGASDPAAPASSAAGSDPPSHPTSGGAISNVATLLGYLLKP